MCYALLNHIGVEVAVTALDDAKRHMHVQRRAGAIYKLPIILLIIRHAPNLPGSVYGTRIPRSGRVLAFDARWWTLFAELARHHFAQLLERLLLHLANALAGQAEALADGF